MEGESFETLPSSAAANTAPETGFGVERLQQSAAQEAAAADFSPENNLKNLEVKTQAGQQEIARLAELVSKSKSELDGLRERMGLPPTEDDPPGLASEAERLP
jgi:hypothetical protein